MAIQRLNYDKLISGAVSNVIPYNQYKQFNSSGSTFTVGSFEQDSASFRPSPRSSFNPYLVPLLSKNLGLGSFSALGSGGFTQVLTALESSKFPEDELTKAFSQAEAYRSFAAPGIAVGTARLAGTAPAYERTVLGATVSAGAFVQSPNIKKLGYSDLVSRGALPAYEISQARGNLVSQARGLTYTERIGLADVSLVFGGVSLAEEVAIQDVPKIYSPAESILGGKIPSPKTITQTPSRAQTDYYQSYVSSLPGYTQRALEAYTPGTRSGLAALAGGSVSQYETYAGARTGALGPTQTSGNLAVDITAGLARNEYQQQVITATKIPEVATILKGSTTKAFATLSMLPMAPSPYGEVQLKSSPSPYAETQLKSASSPYAETQLGKLGPGVALPSAAVTKLQAQGPIKVTTVSIPTLTSSSTGQALPRQTTAGYIEYAAVRELAGIIQLDKEVYKYKDSIVTFDLFYPKPTLLPR